MIFSERLEYSFEGGCRTPKISPHFRIVEEFGDSDSLMEHIAKKMVNTSKKYSRTPNIPTDKNHTADLKHGDSHMEPVAKKKVNPEKVEELYRILCDWQTVLKNISLN